MKRLDLKDFKDMQELVEYNLEKYPQTRDNDDLLYWAVCCYLYGREKMEQLSFRDSLFRRQELCLPPRTSIIRNRNYVQERRPDLRGEEYNKRMDLKEDCREAYGYGR